MSFWGKPTAAIASIIAFALSHPPVTLGATMDARADAAFAAADSPSCKGLSFYWEIGTGDGDFRGGQKLDRFGRSVSRHTQGPVASASKWIYATYAVQRAAGAIDPKLDVPMLNFSSGYDQLKTCRAALTVEQCGHSRRVAFNSASIGRFSYSPAHMQKQAAVDHFRSLGISELTAATLGPVIAATLGVQPDTRVPNPDRGRLRLNIPIGLAYTGPVLGSDASVDPGTYATMLQNILSGALQMRSHLGSNSVCASDAFDSRGMYLCSSDGGRTSTVDYSPSIPNELVFLSTGKAVPWRYSLGHWIENDGTFSSIGAYGFYPWIDKDKRWYGILAQYTTNNVLSYQSSLKCGRAIRNAWLNAS